MVGRSIGGGWRLAALAWLALFTPASAQTAAEIARKQAPAVVVLETLDDRGAIVSQGSGFIVTPAGAIVTSLHVLRGAVSVRVRLASGDLYQTSDVVDIDEHKDIAIIRIKGYHLPVVTLGDSDKIEAGEPVVAISSPEGLANSLSTGIVSGVRRLETHRVFQVTAPISQGSSGGALFNVAGEVIGIVTYVLKSGQNINFAIPINYARGLIADETTGSLAALNSRIEPGAAREPAGQAAVPGTPEPGTSTPVAPVIPVIEDAALDDQIAPAARAKRKRGRTSLDPVFPRPDEALALFYRVVDGIGIMTAAEVDDLTRTAAVVWTGAGQPNEECTIRYLSYHQGMTIRFSQPDRIVTTVEMLISWSIADLRNTFGDKFKRRMLDGVSVLDYGRLASGKSLLAFLDANGNVRTLRFTRPVRPS